jgi:hypothetical protein
MLNKCATLLAACYFNTIFRSVIFDKKIKINFYFSFRKGEKKMFVSFTDWEFDGNVDNAVEAAKGFWPEMKKYGAVNMRATVTGENTIRTMTLWSDQKMLEANIDKIRAAAGSAVGMTVTGGMTGPLAVELD